MTTLWQHDQQTQIAIMARELLPLAEAAHLDQSFKADFLNELKLTAQLAAEKRLTVPRDRGIVTAMNWLIREGGIDAYTGTELGDRFHDLYAAIYTHDFPLIDPNVVPLAQLDEAAFEQLGVWLRALHQAFAARDEAYVAEALAPSFEYHSKYQNISAESWSKIEINVWSKNADKTNDNIVDFSSDQLDIRPLYDGCRIRISRKDSKKFICYVDPSSGKASAWGINLVVSFLHGAWSGFET